jgi:hypothetical protein
MGVQVPPRAPLLSFPMKAFESLRTRSACFLIGACLLTQNNRGATDAVVQTAGMPAASTGMQKLKVNGHYLTREDGRPFFLLQDTAWALPKLSPSDIDTYLSDRAAKNFTAILIALKYHDDILFHEHGPWLKNNTDTPDLTFWNNVDYIVTKAASKGLYVSITMMWTEDYRSLGLTSDPDKAYRMGRWIGDRYKNQNNIIWVLSGEYNYGDWPKVYDKVAQGLKEGDLGGHLLTIHPGSRPAGSSSANYQKSSWLSFNLLQSGAYIDNHAHENFREGYDLVTRDWNLSPIKPVMDGECAYEDLPDGWSYTHDDTAPLIGSDTIRRKAYWSVFAGACGHTYGDANVEMINTGENRYGARKLWQAGLSDPGSSQVQHLRNLIEAHSFLNRIPDQWLIVSRIGSGLDHVRATKASDGSYALIYIPRGTTIKIDLTKIAKPRVNASWFNPRDGSRSAIGNYAATGSQSFTPPGKVSTGNDWVLVLESTSSSPTPTPVPTATPTPSPTSIPTTTPTPAP